VLAAVLRRINRGARIPLVGLITQSNAAEPPPDPNLRPLLVQRALIQGFIVSDHPGREADFLRDVSGWLKEGKIRYKEDSWRAWRTLRGPSGACSGARTSASSSSGWATIRRGRGGD
jgi:NADPH-dependent curcumin reductase CurA